MTIGDKFKNKNTNINDQKLPKLCNKFPINLINKDIFKII